MLDAIKSMLASKKFLASMIGLVVGLVAKLGIQLDTEAVLACVSPILLFILGQGVADIGKEKAKVELNK